jgi:carbonic anhydrase
MISLWKVIALCLIVVANTNYDFDTLTCRLDDKQQSPININLEESRYYDEKYFRFLTNNYTPIKSDNTWKYFEEERAVGVDPKETGSFILVRDWAMFNFKLEKILFRTPAEHTLNGAGFDVEMQLVHSLDGNYYPPGRRVDLNGFNNLVISLFFKITDDADPSRSMLFNFMNLDPSTNTGTAFKKDLKFHHIIQHQPSYLYEGSLTFPECQKALWLIFSQYHLIGQTDYNNLRKMINTATGIQNNNRYIFPNNVNVPIYRNWNDKSMMVERPTLMVYNSSKYLSYSYFFALVLYGLFIIF